MQRQMEDVSLRKILLCIQKYCTDKVCFQGLPPDEQVAEFQNMTNQMLTEEMKKRSPDTENVETLAANYTLVMTNAMSNKCKEKRQLSFVTDDYDAGLAKQAIDNQFKLSWKYKAAEMVLKRNKKRRKALVAVLILIVILGLIAFGGSFVLKNNASKAREDADNLTKNVTIFDNIIGIFGANQERAEKEETLRSEAEDSQNLSKMFLIAGVAVLIMLLAGIIIVSRAIKSSRKVLNDWKDYQLVCGFLESAARKAMEGKSLWQF